MNRQAKPNTGTLWHNSKRSKPDSPDVTGSVEVNGVPMRVAGWWRRSEAQKGELYLSLAFSEPQPQKPEGGAK